MKLLFSFLIGSLIFALAPAKAVTLSTVPIHSTGPHSGQAPQMALTPFSKGTQKWSNSLSWRERVGVFLLKRQLRREMKSRRVITGAEDKVRGQAVAALACGIGSLLSLAVTFGLIFSASFSTVVAFFVITFLLGGVGILFGVSALADQNIETSGGKGLALGGLVCGILGGAISLAALLLIAAVITH